jgi:Zn-dependent peptidase ImmA (M78 family)
MGASDLPASKETINTLIADSDITEESLIELLGSSEAYTQLVEGDRLPTLHEATLLGALFQVNPSLLLQEREATLGVSLRLGGLEDVDGLGETMRHVGRLLAADRLSRAWGFQERQTDISSFSISAKWHDKEAGKITASRLRAYLGLEETEPIVQLTELVEELGYPVEYLPLPETVHGIASPERREGYTAWIVLISSSVVWARQRFTLAHELSHILQRDEGQIIVDHAELPDKRPERIADSFARHLLLPDEAIHDTLGEFGQIATEANLCSLMAELMLSYGVSRDATVVALRESATPRVESQLIDACANMSVNALMARAGRASEWYESEGARNFKISSQRLSRQVLNAYAHGLISLQTVADVIADSDIFKAKTLLHDAGWEDLLTG